MEDNFLDNIVDDIVNQLQNTTQEVKKQSRELNITPDNVEQFLIDNASKLIQRAVDATEDIDATDPEAAEALAELIKASSAAIDALNKLYISREKNRTSQKLKKMEIKAKERLAIGGDEKTRITFSREEILKHLFAQQESTLRIDSPKKIIDVD